MTTELELNELSNMLAAERARSRALESELSRALTVIDDMTPKLKDAQAYGKYICDVRLRETDLAYEDTRLLAAVFGSPGDYQNRVPLSAALNCARKCAENIEELMKSFEALAGTRVARDKDERMKMSALGFRMPIVDAPDWADKMHAAIDSFVAQVKEPEAK